MKKIAKKICTAKVMTVTILMVLLADCGTQNRKQENTTDDKDSIPVAESVSKVMGVMKEKDPSKFASLVDYPLKRPYPLKDVNDSVQMVTRYKDIVDDSLINVVSSSQASDWSDLGWKGWTLDEGQYLWVSDKIYSVPYLSKRERKLLDDAKKKELATLPVDFRTGWDPQFCLLDPKENYLYRMDAEMKGGKFRLMKFKKARMYHQYPDRIFMGSEHNEGTEENRIYELKGNNGELLELFKDDTGEGIKMTVIGKDSIPQEIEVEEVYWMDYIPQ